MHFSADVLSATNHLSKLWQYRELCFSVIRKELHNCIETLEELRVTNRTIMAVMENELNADPVNTFKGSEITFGPQCSRADQRQQFRQTRAEFIDQFLMKIRAWFPKHNLLTAMQIFEPASYPADRCQLIASETTFCKSFWGTMANQCRHWVRLKFLYWLIQMGAWRNFYNLSILFLMTWASKEQTRTERSIGIFIAY